MAFTQATISGASGKVTDVTQNNQLLVDTRAEAAFACQNGNAYSALADVTVASTDDDFFHLTNNDTRDLVIYKIQGWADDASQEITIELGGGSDTGNGDVITPGNLRAGGGAASVTCVEDATDLAVVGGTAVDLLKLHATVLLLSTYDYPSGLVLPSSTSMHANAALAGLINLNVFFYFRTPD